MFKNSTKHNDLLSGSVIIFLFSRMKNVTDVIKQVRGLQAKEPGSCFHVIRMIK